MSLKSSTLQLGAWMRDSVPSRFGQHASMYSREHKVCALWLFHMILNGGFIRAYIAIKCYRDITNESAAWIYITAKPRRNLLLLEKK
jgi:hypothetical protein